MNFLEAVRIRFSKYADFSGRATRSEFWWWALFEMIVSFILVLIAPILSQIFALATIVPSLAVTARRLHDINRSGWWQLISLVPLVGWIILLYWAIQDSEGPNDFD